MPKREGLHDAFIRVPEELWAEFCAVATAEDRSATQQAVHVMRRYVEEYHKQHGRPPKKAAKPRRRPPAP